MWSKLKKIFGSTPGSPEGHPAPDSKSPSPDSAPPDLGDYYAVLGLPEGSDLNTVRRAWKAKLKEVHRDHYAEDPETKRRAQEQAHRINEAYHTLQDHLF